MDNCLAEKGSLIPFMVHARYNEINKFRRKKGVCIMNISEIMAETGSIIVGRDAHSRIIVRSKQDGSICWYNSLERAASRDARIRDLHLDAAVR